MGDVSVSQFPKKFQPPHSTAQRCGRCPSKLRGLAERMLRRTPLVPEMCPAISQVQHPVSDGEQSIPFFPVIQSVVVLAFGIYI